MAFVVAVVLTLAFELFAPFVLIALVWWRVRPRVTFAWATGLGGAAIGAALFYAVILIERALDFSALWSEGSEGLGLAKRALGDATVAAGTEEVVRFGAALWLFRSAGSRAPLVAGLMFGLGWGGFECARIGLFSANYFLPILAHETWERPLPFMPLTGAWERGAALVLHVGLTAFAVKAAIEARARRWRNVALAFLGAFAIHLALDWVVGWYGIPGRRAMENEDYARGVRWLLTMECWFAAGAVATLSLAARLSDLRPSSSLRR